MSTPHPAHGRPTRPVLEGRFVRLEPLGQQHAADLYAASSAADADQRFRYLPSAPPLDLEDMHRWIALGETKDDPMYFAAIDRANDKAVGRQALMNIVPEHGVIEVGSIYWGPQMSRTRLATEALYLSARHIFDDLGYRRFEWKCNAVNEPSRRAALRFGFIYEGTFRQHMIVKGQSRDTAWFSMLDGDWPRLRAEYERWLDPQNFDADGTQKSKLSFD